MASNCKILQVTPVCFAGMGPKQFLSHIVRTWVAVLSESGSPQTAIISSSLNSWVAIPAVSLPRMPSVRDLQDHPYQRTGCTKTDQKLYGFCTPPRLLLCYQGIWTHCGTRKRRPQKRQISPPFDCAQDKQHAGAANPETGTKPAGQPFVRLPLALIVWPSPASLLLCLRASDF